MKRAVDRSVGSGVMLAFRVLCILLLAALLAGILISETQRSADTVGREKATLASYTSVDRLTGYVFRDEIALHSSNNGPVVYEKTVPEGSLVQAGAMLAEVYVDDTGTDKRQRAAALYEEIARLERALERDAAAWQVTYTASYAALMERISIGDWQNGLAATAGISEALERRSALSPEAEAAVKDRISALRDTAESLVQYVDDPEKLVAAENGYFCRSTDGYEALFGVSAAEQLTPEGLERLLAEENPSSDTVGKLIRDGAFYLAIPTKAALAATYTVGGTYRVQLSQGNEISMQVARITPSENGADALLLLYAERMPAGMDFSRRQTVAILRETVNGICVPEAAVFTENGEDFVYVAAGGVAARRRVTVLHRKGGCCLVTPNGAEGYLAVGETVLITARSLYEGKVLI